MLLLLEVLGSSLLKKYYINSIDNYNLSYTHIYHVLYHTHTSCLSSLYIPAGLFSNTGPLNS